MTVREYGNSLILFKTQISQFSFNFGVLKKILLLFYRDEFYSVFNIGSSILELVPSLILYNFFFGH